MEPARIPEEFPAPEFRPTQERALADIRDAFAAGNEVVLVRAPTGSGKSLLARAVAGSAARGSGASATDPVGAYYTTPQVSQLDDVAADPLLQDLSIIRGKNNYDCILPGETDTPVDRAPCARERGFDCQVEHRCPYFSDRAIAANRAIAAMTLAYFMQTAGSTVFGTRDVVVVDEAHGLGDWAEMYATIDLGPRTVPGWAELTPGPVESLDDAAAYAQRLRTACERGLTELRRQAELTPDETARRDRLSELRSDLGWFLEEYRNPESPTTWVVDQAEPGDPVTITPMNPERYLKHTVWDRGRRFALFSATILDGAAFCASVGLDTDRVALVDVPHTFPVEHRPLYDVTQGKMTYDRRDETLPALARTLVRLMQHHPDEKGLVHCHSYDIQARLADHLDGFGVGARVRTHDRDNRDAELESWGRSTEPELFLSVKMEEALDLEGSACRWQLLCKAPYPNTQDSRVAARLDDGRWGWYYRATLRTVIQACGRVVRSPEDHGATYLGDSSLLDVFERTHETMPDWFADQVDRMRRPDLPDVDPSAALEALDGGRHGRNPSGSTPTDGRSSGAGGRSRRSDGADDHPLSDVWGE